MKRIDAILVSLIVIGFGWLGWRIYFSQNPPLKQITTVSVEELTGNPSTLSGDTRAGYILIEFGDYECPPCAKLFPQIKDFVKENSMNVRFQFRHFPLAGHFTALPSAVLAEMAREKGLFEIVHQELYSHNGKLEISTLTQIAKKHSLPNPDFGSIKNQRYKATITQDKNVGMKVPVNGTPALYLCTPDQKIYEISSIEQAKKLIR